MTDWLSVTHGDAPLIVSIPHAGTIIPDDFSGLISLDLARRDADRRYAFATDLRATIIPNRYNGASCDAVLCGGLCQRKLCYHWPLQGRLDHLQLWQTSLRHRRCANGTRHQGLC